MTGPTTEKGFYRKTFLYFDSGIISIFVLFLELERNCLYSRVFLVSAFLNHNFYVSKLQHDVVPVIKYDKIKSNVSTQTGTEV